MFFVGRSYLIHQPYFGVFFRYKFLLTNKNKIVRTKVIVNKVSFHSIFFSSDILSNISAKDRLFQTF